MKTLLSRIILMTLFMTGTVVASTHDESKVVIKNPEIATGIHIGDSLSREVIIEASTGEKVIPSSLPVRGVRTDGIELVEIKHSSDQKGANVTHTLKLRYQVFADSVRPVVMSLPAESIQLEGGREIEIPSWDFWFSPLVDTELADVLSNIQPQDRAPLIDVAGHKSGLVMYLVVLMFGLVGIVYVNGDRQWLPFMGGAFSRAHRSIKKIARSREDDDVKLRRSLLSLHQAFNQTYGRNLFQNEVTSFTAQNPRYQKMEADIRHFFELSNHALFSRSERNPSDLMTSLFAFSKRLRNCERGVS